MKASVWKRLCEEVSRIVGSRNVRDDDSTIFYALPDKEVPSGDMFHAAEMLGIVGYIDSTLVVTKHTHGLAASLAELVEDFG